MNIFQKLKLLKILKKSWSYTAYSKYGDYFNVQFTIKKQEDFRTLEKFLKGRRKSK